MADTDSVKAERESSPEQDVKTEVKEEPVTPVTNAREGRSLRKRAANNYYQDDEEEEEELGDSPIGGDDSDWSGAESKKAKSRVKREVKKKEPAQKKPRARVKKESSTPRKPRTSTKKPSTRAPRKSSKKKKATNGDDNPASPAEEVKKEAKKEEEEEEEEEEVKEEEPMDDDKEEEDDDDKDQKPVDMEKARKQRRWTSDTLIAESTSIETWQAKAVMKLLDQECTIPFIARYRKAQTGNLEPEKLRDIQESYENLKQLNKKVENVIKTLAKEKKASGILISALINAKSLTEVELLYGPYKNKGGKRTLADRARSRGLEASALELLSPWKGGQKLPDPQHFIKPGVKGLENVEEVLTGWQHILADHISKDRDVLDYITKVCKTAHITISSCLSAAAKKNDCKAFVEGKQTENYKFENYYNFSTSIRIVKPHQVLGMNRGENLKVLTVKVALPPHVGDDFKQWCRHHWNIFQLPPAPRNLMEKSLEDCFQRLLEPHLIRQARSELTRQATKESVDVFCTNLRSLLLTPPVRGKVVLGIDPGFKHGCKLAVVDLTCNVLATDTIFPFRKGQENLAAQRLRRLLCEYKCDSIALGNGTACRETETFLTNLITRKYFFPLEQVKYCIVNENGASIYSITKEAEAELPNLDPNLRSAVSIARRLQDPLLEYVKVEPKHLGVGMYQHDVPSSQLQKALDTVLVECVSFVGVDLNVCPEFLLKKVSGLNAAKTHNIVQWRQKHGPFTCREQLLEVKGLGPKSYEQCSGFVKVFPQTAIGSSKDVKKEEEDDEEEEEIKGGKRKKTCAGGSKKKKKFQSNLLDATMIHPESYTLADRFLEELGASHHDVGSQELLEKVRAIRNVAVMAATLQVPTSTLQLIVDALRTPLEYDIRSEMSQPLFKKGVMSASDLKLGTVLSGQVINTTHFGAFVDIGVGFNGLLHSSKMRVRLNLGDKVEVTVISLDLVKKRIGLELKHKL